MPHKLEEKRRQFLVQHMVPPFTATATAICVLLAAPRSLLPATDVANPAVHAASATGSLFSPGSRQNFQCMPPTAKIILICHRSVKVFIGMNRISFESKNCPLSVMSKTNPRNLQITLIPTQLLEIMKSTDIHHSAQNPP